MIFILTNPLMCGLAACGNSGGGSSEGGSDAKDEGGSDGKVSINVIAAQYGQNTKTWWEDFVKDFMAEHSDIDLTVEVESWNDIYTVVNTRISNNDAPDILNIDVFANYQADNLLPAEDFVSKETYDKMYPAFLEQSDVDGTIWAIPDLASARALYYNADILKDAQVEVPTTWDDLTEACKAIKAHDSKIYPWGIDMTTDEGQAAFAYYTWNNGGGFVDDEGNWTPTAEALCLISTSEREPLTVGINVFLLTSKSLPANASGTGLILKNPSVPNGCSHSSSNILFHLDKNRRI